MTLFCKQCNGRRLPLFQYAENHTLWLCETCENFADADDVIIREFTKSEKDKINVKLEEFEESTKSLSAEKMTRRKGVN